MASKDLIRIHIVIPFAQPLTATDAEMAQATRSCYVPLLDALEQAENVRLTLHFSGHLLDYMARRQEGFMLRLKALMKRGQIEILGGLFYGGMPGLVPEADLRGQIEMASEFWDSYVGHMPKGFWLPALSVTPELPRLLDETGLDYGFVADTQLRLRQGESCDVGLGVLERGGLTTGLFVLDQQLSRMLPGTDVPSWMAQAAIRGKANPHRLLSVWVRAESLGLEPATHAHVHEQGWLAAFFQALSEGRVFEPVLPADTFPSVRPCCALRLGDVCAPALGQAPGTEAVTDWADYPYLFAEVDLLLRRMLRASARLRDAIATMEDEGLEEAWSDKLATAQRLVFSAQSHDAYWQGLRPGFTTPALRDATFARVARAEAILDRLMFDAQGTGFVTIDEQDRDGDLAEEIFVSTARLMAWLVPATGGDVRALDDRSRECNVLDAGSRRQEPFFATIKQGDALIAEAGVPKIRGQSRALKKRLKSTLPMDVDKVQRVGMRQWVVAADTTAEALLTGAATDLKSTNIAWDVLRNGVADELAPSYTLAQIGGFALRGPGKRHIEVQRETKIPMDAAELVSTCRLSLTAAGPVRWALEVPVRLGSAPMQLSVDGVVAKAEQRCFENVKHVQLAGQDGQTLVMALEGEDGQAVDLWCMPLMSTVQQLDGFNATSQGFVLMPTVVLRHEACVRVHISLTPKDHN
jgi:alpha-amylase